jgi:hypothetical protein
MLFQLLSDEAMHSVRTWVDVPALMDTMQHQMHKNLQFLQLFDFLYCKNNKHIIIQMRAAREKIL